MKPQVSMQPWMTHMVVLKRTALSVMASIVGEKMMAKVAPRKAKEPPWMMGRRSPKVDWTSVLRPETKKMTHVIVSMRPHESRIASTVSRVSGGS